MPWLMLATHIGVIFLALFAVSEFAYSFFYDDRLPGLWWRALGSSLLLGLIAWRFPITLDTIGENSTMVFAAIIAAALWVLAYWLALGFHPGHAAILGLACWLILAPALSLMSQSKPAAKEIPPGLMPPPK
jgi:hypothetical protein